MLDWGQLLHFYQPPIQTYEWLARITEESYRPLLRVFAEYPYARATFNVNAVLLDLFHEHSLDDVITQLRLLVDRGQVEITGTGKYHPILPMLPNDEQTRQIELDRETKRRYFGPNWRTRGFFPPELAYSPVILEPVRLTGHDWLLLAGVAHPAEWPTRHVDRVEARDGTMAVLYRDDILSNRISFRTIDAPGFVEYLARLAPPDGDAYVVTAMDAETYGHHVREWERLFLGEVYRALAPTLGGPERRGLPHEEATRLEREPVVPVTMVQLSEIVDHFPAGPIVAAAPSSWSTSDDDLGAGNPLPLWFALDNEVHRLQWEHLGIAVEMVRTAESLADSETARRFAATARGRLDQAEHSCQWWWASRRPMWDINMVHRGLTLQIESLVNAYRAIDLSGAEPAIKRAHYRQYVIARDLRDRIESQFFETR